MKLSLIHIYSVREGLKTALGSTIYTTQDISAITDALLKEYSSAQILSTSSISLSLIHISF